MRISDWSSDVCSSDLATMTKVLVLYHSMYGHVEKMAEAVAAGAREVGGVQVTVKRGPETMPEEAFKKAGGQWDQDAPVADPAELAASAAINFRHRTRLCNMTRPMRNLHDHTGGLGGK